MFIQDPPPTMETIDSLLPTICKILTYGDKHVLSDACWALSYITDGNNDRIQVIILLQLLYKIMINVLMIILYSIGRSHIPLGIEMTAYQICLFTRTPAPRLHNEQYESWLPSMCWLLTPQQFISPSNWGLFRETG